MRVLCGSSQVVAAPGFPKIHDKPANHTIAGLKMGRFSERRGMGFRSPRSVRRGVSIGCSGTRKTLKDLGKGRLILASRALPATGPIQRSGRPRFRVELAALSFHLTVLCPQETHPPVGDLPVRNTLRSDEPAIISRPPPRRRLPKWQPAQLVQIPPVRQIPCRRESAHVVRYCVGIGYSRSGMDVTRVSAGLVSDLLLGTRGPSHGSPQPC